MKRLFKEHETVASVLTIILTVFTLNTWLVRDIREDVKALNVRLDHMYQIMIQHITGEKQ